MNPCYMILEMLNMIEKPLLGLANRLAAYYLRDLTATEILEVSFRVVACSCLHKSFVV